MSIDDKLVEDLNYFLGTELDSLALTDYQRTHSSYNFAKVVEHFTDYTESEIKRLLRIIA